jgi:hypothetical protein
MLKASLCIVKTAHYALNYIIFAAPRTLLCFFHVKKMDL